MHRNCKFTTIPSFIISISFRFLGKTGAFQRKHFSFRKASFACDRKNINVSFRKRAQKLENSVAFAAVAAVAAALFGMGAADAGIALLFATDQVKDDGSGNG